MLDLEAGPSFREGHVARGSRTEESIAVPLPPRRGSTRFRCGHRGPGQPGSGHLPQGEQTEFLVLLACHLPVSAIHVKG